MLICHKVHSTKTLHKHCSVRVHIEATNELYLLDFNLRTCRSCHTVKLVRYPQSVKNLKGSRHTEFRRPTHLIRTQFSNWPHQVEPQHNGHNSVEDLSGDSWIGRRRLAVALDSAFVVDERIGVGFDVLPVILYSVVSGVGGMAKFRHQSRAEGCDEVHVDIRFPSDPSSFDPVMSLQVAGAYTDMSIISAVLLKDRHCVIPEAQAGRQYDKARRSLPE
jgi:hypothetical protein